MLCAASWLVIGTYWATLFLHKSKSPDYLGRYSAPWLVFLVGVGVLWLGLTFLVRARAQTWVWARRGQILLATVTTVLCLGLVEMSTRAYFAVSRSPYYWQWGSAHARQMMHFGNANAHSVEGKGYFKFPPNRVLHQGTYSHPFPTRINNLGFRGPDVEVKKPDDVTRVVCLGGSSTFGYFASDGHTYPDYLNRALNENRSSTDQRFEVLNLGIPHMNSAAIRALFLREALPLEPDIVVLYTGTNDTIFTPPPSGFWGKFRSWSSFVIGQRSLAWYVVSQRFAERPFYSLPTIESASRQKATAFVANMTAMAEECRQRGIVLLPITQQHTSLFGRGPVADLDTTTYGQERDLVRRAVEQRQGTDNQDHVWLLVHDVLMQQLRTWSRQQNIALIDGIAALDAHRERLHSWVHLDEQGNALLAETIATQILRMMNEPRNGTRLTEAG